ncbi:MAG: SpoIVB peptidase S55 domain-containing protein [Capsulimonadaceae bacterium]|nr:SpoIVB peptidase S55 domain-containing protein [Capsulimonadaceae bacterium]
MPVRPLLAVAIALLFASLASSAPASTPPSAAPVQPAPVKHVNHGWFDTARFCPVADIRPGQTGYALTVFQGTKIERFGIVVRGVLKKMNNGRDLVLIRMTDGQAVARNAMIAHGMSGSPVYIGNRLVGAIAYGFSFPREPLAMVTPIGDMLQSWSPRLPNSPTPGIGPGAPSQTGQIAVNNALLAALLAPSESREISSNPEGSTQLVPLSMPLMVSGMSQRSLARLGKSLAPYGLFPMASGSGGSLRPPTAQDRASLVPGAAVGCSLVQGDIDFTGIGTLTYRDGNRIVAFGHPMLESGAIDAPMTTATITDLYPSLYSSTKLGKADVTVGRITQDRAFSIGGIVGEMPRMVPVTVDVTDRTKGTSKTFHARMINHPVFTPLLIPAIVGDAIYQVHPESGEAVATAKLDVDTVQTGHIQRSNIVFDAMNVGDAAMVDIASLMMQLRSNPYEPVTIRSVNFHVEIDAKHPTAEITQISAPKATYEPGETINVGVVVQPYKQEPELRTIPLTIPASTPNGIVIVSIKGGNAGMGDLFAEMFGFGLPSGPPPVNLRQTVRKYLEKPKNDEIVAKLLLPTMALDIEGEKLPLAPPNLAAIIRSRHSTGLKPEKDEVKVTQQTPWVISGNQTLRIKVARKNTLDTPTHAGGPQPSDMDAAGDQSFPPGFLDTLGSPQAAISGAPLAALAEASPVPATIAIAASGKPTMAPDTSTPPGDASSDAAKPSVKKATTVARQPVLWRQDRAEQFMLGKFDETAVSNLGRVQPGASPIPFASSPASYALCLTTDDKGAVYMGTGDAGAVYKVTPQGAEPFFKTDEVEVTALAYDACSGTLLAGSAPNGSVYRIGMDGKGEKVYQTYEAGEKYITALAIDSARGVVYIGTGGGQGRIYRAPLKSIGDARPFYTSASAHILALAVDSKGVVYATGSPDGIVYAIDAIGSARVIYSAGEQNVTGLAIGKNDAVYIGTSPKGALIKLTLAQAGAPAVVKQLLPKIATPVNAMQAAAGGSIWAAGGATLYRILPDDSVLSSASDTDPRFISLAVASDGTAYAGAADIAQVYRANPSDRPATYTSPVHDAKVESQWGAIAWDADAAQSSAMHIRTRSGEIATPDGTWSAWSDPYSVSQGSQIVSPAARYIQYQAQFDAALPEPATALRDVRISYLGENQPPVVKLQTPLGGDAISGDFTVRWSASDPDKDTLAFELAYSTNGVDWTVIKKDAQSTGDKKQRGADAPAASQEKPKRGGKRPHQSNSSRESSTTTIVMKAGDPPIPTPPGLDGQATIESAVEIVEMGASSPGEPPTPSGAPAEQGTPSTQVWKTANVPDGRYWIKIVASDRPSNPVGSLSDDDQCGPVIVDNTPPKIAVDGSRAVDDQKRLTLTGIATANLAAIVSVQYKVGDSPVWYSATPSGPAFTQTIERFTLTTAPLSTGVNKVTVQAVNKAGKSDETTISVTLP